MDPLRSYVEEDVSVYQMDAMELVRSLPDKSIDAVITDPPYGTTANEWDIAPDWPEFVNECLRVSKGVVAIFSQLPVAADVVNANRKKYRYDIVWKKTSPVGFLDAKRKPLRAHEVILVFADKGYGEYHPQMREGFTPYRGRSKGSNTSNYGKFNAYETVNKDGTRYPIDVLEFKSAVHKGDHPTQKPLDLLRYLVRTFSGGGGAHLRPLFGKRHDGSGRPRRRTRRHRLRAERRLLRRHRPQTEGAPTYLGNLERLKWTSTASSSPETSTL